MTGASAGREPMVEGDDDPFFGRMNDPTGGGAICGPCGDEMEFYLYVRGDVIEDVKYYTDGCENTRSCGAAVARRAQAQRKAQGCHPLMTVSPPAPRRCRRRLGEREWTSVRSGRRIHTARSRCRLQ